MDAERLLTPSRRKLLESVARLSSMDSSRLRRSELRLQRDELRLRVKALRETLMVIASNTKDSFAEREAREALAKIPPDDWTDI
jgi:hypothetical protein